MLYPHSINNMAPFALYEAVHLNRHFFTVLSHVTVSLDFVCTFIMGDISGASAGYAVQLNNKQRPPSWTTVKTSSPPLKVEKSLINPLMRRWKIRAVYPPLGNKKARSTSYLLYRKNMLLFGLSPTPHIFTKTLKPLVRYWRFNGINLDLFLDDRWLTEAGKSAKVSKQHSTRFR